LNYPESAVPAELYAAAIVELLQKKELEMALVLRMIVIAMPVLI